MRAILVDALGLDADRVSGFDAGTGLFGHLPELDSMAVVALVSALEERFGFVVYDDEIDGAVFATFGTLVDFVVAKRDG